MVFGFVQDTGNGVEFSVYSWHFCASVWVKKLIDALKRYIGFMCEYNSLWSVKNVFLRMSEVCIIIV